MSTQNNPKIIGDAVQYQLASIFSPVKVYANFNRNYHNEGDAGFVTWNLRNIHQPVYTGQTKSNKGIDRPIFQISIFAQDMNVAFNLSNTVLQSLHGYSGQFGSPSTGFFIAKADVNWLYNTYDNEIGLNQIILDCTIDIPT